MVNFVSVKVSIPKPLDLTGKVAKQIPFAVSKALNAVAFKGRTASVAKLRDVFTVRNKFVESGINVERATKTALTAVVGVEERRAFMQEQIEGGKRHMGTDKAGSSIPVSARAKREDKITPSRFAGALLTKDEARKNQRLFFSQLGGDRLMLVRRLHKRSSRSRGVLKRRYKGREAGTPLKPREAIEVVYVFAKDITVKGRWPFPSLVERAVADGWDAEMTKALDDALKS